MRILVVEHDPDLREFIERVIGAGHLVRAFACGSGALAELRVSPPDVIVADLDLDGASGEELARVATELPQPPRVVLMSTNYRRLERSRPLAQASLAKPFAVRELVDALGTAH